MKLSPENLALVERIDRFRVPTGDALHEHVSICASTMEALLNAARADWRPIATAPKDGTVIDVWRPEGGRDTVFWGYPDHECGEMGRLCDSDWHGIRAPGWVCNTFGGFLGRKHAPFTHWMPLPAAPSDAPGEGTER